jgi:putative cell wall-binding protein
MHTRRRAVIVLTVVAAALAASSAINAPASGNPVRPLGMETTAPPTTTPPTTAGLPPATTTTTQDVPSEPSGVVETTLETSTVEPGDTLPVEADIDVGTEEPIPPGTSLEAIVKIAEGDTEPLFNVRATIGERGHVELDVTFPDDTPPGVYLVILVVPGAFDDDGTPLRRPRVVIAPVVVGARGATSTAAATKTADAEAARLGGGDRYSTARQVAGLFDGVVAPIVTTDESYPDALAASYLAGGMRAPILLTPSDEMDRQLPDALRALGATGVEIVGGTAAVSESVQAAIEAAGFTTTRLGGADRYDTARQLATLIPPEGVGSFGRHGRTAVLASGESFADALTAAPMSYSQGWPMLLTTSSALHEAARSAIVELGIEHVVMIGGTDAISSAVVDDLATLGVSVQRLAGDDRTYTALAVAEFLFEHLSYDANDLAIARGDTFPDALAAGPRGGDEVLPVLLIPSLDDLGPAARTFISDHRDVLESIEVIGGTGAVSAAVRAEALALARTPPG